MKYIFLVLFFVGFWASSQVLTQKEKTISSDNDTLVVDSGHKDSLQIFKPTIEDYQFFTQNSSKKIFDTVFTIEKSYEFTQFNNKDNFGKIQFANVGSGFQPLSYELNREQTLSLLPTNKSFGIKTINDIRYYDVKTPTTAFIYHNSVRNGGTLQSTYTQNIGKNFNFAIEYYGLRSQGLYTRSLAASNNVILSAHYLSKSGKYEAFAHYIHQNINNEEYGGISDLSLFLGGDSRFNNRLNLAVNLQNSESRFGYRRYYFSQQFAPFNVEKFPFKIKHTIFHQGNKYYFSQNSLEPYYTNLSPVIDNPTLNAKKFSDNLSNTVSLVFDKEAFKLEGGVRYQNIKFGTDAILTPNNAYNKVYSENRLGVVGNLQIKLFKKFDLISDAEYSNGSSFGNMIRIDNTASFQPVEGYKASFILNVHSAAPSFNYLLNYSPYQNFNYDFSNFKNQNSIEMGGKIKLKYFDTELFAKYYRIDNFTYIDENLQPQQMSSSTNISQIGGEATFHYHQFHLNTRLQFQNTLTNKSVFPAPDFIGRINVYWQSKAFKNAAELQTGIKTYYFTKFASRDFSPILNEFIAPNANEYSIGGQPIVDVYFNMKVKRMFFYVEGQQITNTFARNKSFTAPYYPYYDFRLNLGIVWYLFH